MAIRKPVVAGQFYPADHEKALAEIRQCLAEEPISKPLPDSIVAGIVPHAGWVFSGALAGMVFSAVKQRHEKVDTFILFGAVHSYYGAGPAVYDTGSWLSPLGEIAIDEDLAKAVLKSSVAVGDTDAHRGEHSIEVQVPFVQHLFGEATILPILVPPSEDAMALGEAVGKIIRNEKKKIVCIGSSDLTHYGPRYGFAPMGGGKDGLDWASNVNDQKFIDLAVKMEPEKLLAEAAVNHNACGPGAAAATIAEAKEMGKTEGLLLAHTDSNRIMMRKMGTSSQESVGYAAIVF